MAEKGDHGSTGSYSGPPRMQTAGLLSVFSVLLVIEGVTRTNLYIDRNSDWDGDSRIFPRVVLLIAGLVEIVFSFSGLLVGLGELFLELGNATLTLFSMFTMLIGWFTYVVYTLAYPSFIVDKASSGYDPLTESEYRGIQIMGIFGSVAYCGALQGGQFFFAHQLYHIQMRQSGEVYTRSYYKGRLYCYSFFVLLAGLSQLVAGCIVIDRLATGELHVPQVASPYIIIYPEMTITVSVLIICYGFFGIAAAMNVIPLAEFRTNMAGALFSAFIFVAQIGFMDLPQAGLQGDNYPSHVSLGSMQPGLLLALVLMPAYLISKLSAIDPGVAPV
ncbi:hypothetical protein CBR_g29279 [Chara braunii]|uniref:Uncharacterized protein n=1 Tax=Chara braunii TaxID=69332 RepID=A0A388LA86_CHABU|nr:hypothetical protein CBR_g29279 [Chara braunii]|eukprot:GBG79227.1 hypothetical protein CBR_g29279 [Chara braunii]